MGRELTCKELVELVTGYLDGTLPARQRRRFEAHIAACDRCTAYLAQMETILRITGTLSEEAVSGDQKAVLLSAFRDWKAS